MKLSISGTPEWSPKKAVDLVDFLKMQYPDNSAMQIMAAAQAMCMIALEHDVNPQNFVIKVAKIIMTWPGWDLGKERTKKMYEEAAQEEKKNVN